MNHFRFAASSIALSFALGLISHHATAGDVAANDTTKPADNTLAVEKVGTDLEAIVMKGEPFTGYIVTPADKDTFKFVMKGSDKPMVFFWKDLDELERKRVQKLYGMEVAGDSIKFGEKVEGARWKLKTGKTVEGLPTPERDRDGLRAMRTNTMPLLLIPIGDIASEEKFPAFESDFYSINEIYERRLLEKPPSSTNAGEHLEMARWCASVGLYGKAIDHLEQAKIIDPRTDERNQDFRQDLVKRHANKQSEDLFNRMLKEVRAEEYIAALDTIATLDRSYPNSDLHSRWDNLRRMIEEKSKFEINKIIVTLSYRVALELLEKKFGTKVPIDDKGYPIDAIPGKQVTVRNGQVFRGILVAIGDREIDNTGSTDQYEIDQGINKQATTKTGTSKGTNMDDITLKIGDSTIKIAGKEILSITDINLATSNKYAIPSYEQLKDFVTNLNDPNGLKMQMCLRLSKVVKISDKEVKKIFDGRLEKIGTFDGEGLKMQQKSYAAVNTAFWGAASWTRPGSKPAKYIKIEDMTNQRNTLRSQRQQYGPNRNGQGGRNQQGQQQAEPEESAEETDDPAIWWKYQDNETKFGLLKAMMAEKVFKTYNVTNKPCPNCGATGKIKMQTPGGLDFDQRCPLCRGISVLYRIDYH